MNRIGSGSCKKRTALQADVGLCLNKTMLRMFNEGKLVPESSCEK